MNENLAPKAELYATMQGFEIVERLGSGKDGIVLLPIEKGIYLMDVSPGNIGFPES